MTETDTPPPADSAPSEPSDGSGRRDWIIGLIAIILLVVGPIVIFIGIRNSVEAANADNAWAVSYTHLRAHET